MRVTSVPRKLLGLYASVVICGFELTEAGGGGRPKLVVTLRRKSGTRGRRGRCGVVARCFDNGGGPRAWRHVDISFATSELISAAPRVNCPVHGPTVIEVPWAVMTAGSRAHSSTSSSWTPSARTSWQQHGVMASRGER